MLGVASYPGSKAMLEAAAAHSSMVPITLCKQLAVHHHMAYCAIITHSTTALLTFSSGRTVMSFILHFVFLVVMA